jgi:thiol-disulfide isomerase/thioredoxin
MKKGLLFVVLISFFACKTEPKQVGETPKQLLANTYRAELSVKSGITLPFVFKVEDATHITIFNAEEEIKVDEITYVKDSVFIKLPVFEGFIQAKIEANALVGQFIMPEKGRKMDFKAEVNALRFNEGAKATEKMDGIWETTFSPESENNRYLAKGVFKQTGNIISGTFRTKTGDYRYLEGVLNGNQFQLSAFDGAHAFLFRGEVNGKSLSGTFYSGTHWEEPFVAKINPDFELPSAESLTYLKEGYDSINFSFPDDNGDIVSLDDQRFKDKVVVVQIMGTWCPNCLDESTYLSNYYRKNSKDLEIVGLAFEYVKTNEKAFKNINRLKDRLGITYPILLAQTGSASKLEANDKLPMLNQVLSYPTTIFIDKKAKVRKIYTGFNGPATGEKYSEFKTEFESFVAKLKAE